MIETEFEIDRENSVDKRASHAQDRFGYMSLHYVISMSKDRCAKDEYRHCEGVKTEIQIRSILQHGWAEIEHDLGYKANISLPDHLRRRLSLLSGLLELADSAFLTIRDELTKYENELPTLIQHKPEEVLIDKVSLDVLTTLNDEIRKYDEGICSITGAELIKKDEFLERLVLRYRFVDIKTIDEILQKLSKYQHCIVDLAKNWIKEKDYQEFNNGISLMYLLYLVLANENYPKSISELAREFSLSSDPDDFANRLVPIAQDVFNNPLVNQKGSCHGTFLNT